MRVESDVFVAATTIVPEDIGSSIGFNRKEKINQKNARVNTEQAYFSWLTGECCKEQWIAKKAGGSHQSA